MSVFNEKITEQHINGIRPDARSGSGYANASGDKSGVGSLYTKNSFFPYVDPVDSVDDQDAIKKTSVLKKFNAKLNRNYVSNNPAGPFYTDRGAFVNGASRIDLFENKKFSIKDVDVLLEMHDSLGGISKIYAMGNGAGIYKTSPGKTIGMNIGNARNLIAKKTNKRILRIKDVILGDQEDKEDNEELQAQQEL